MLDPERPQRARRKYLEGLPVEQRSARIVRLIVEIVSQGLEAGLEVPLGEHAAHLQAQAQARQARRWRQALHHRFCRRHEKQRFLGFCDPPQHGGSAPRELVRWLQLIERQGVQSRKYQDLAGRVERVNDAAQPLRPVLVLGEKDETAASGLLPLCKQMESHHAEGRRRRDRGALRSFALLRRLLGHPRLFGKPHLNPFLVLTRRQLNAGRLIPNRQLAAMHMGFAPRTHPSWATSGKAVAIPAVSPLIARHVGTGSVPTREMRPVLSMRESMRSRRSTRGRHEKAPALGATLGRSFKMKRLSNDAFIAAVSPRACELVHTLRQTTSVRRP